MIRLTLAGLLTGVGLSAQATDPPLRASIPTFEPPPAFTRSGPPVGANGRFSALPNALGLPGL